MQYYYTLLYTICSTIIPYYILYAVLLYPTTIMQYYYTLHLAGVTNDLCTIGFLTGIYKGHRIYVHA